MSLYFLPYRLDCFDVSGVARFIIIHRSSYYAPVSASLYAAKLSLSRGAKTGTNGVKLRHLVFLYSWAESCGFDLERALFDGAGLEIFEAEQFSYWLRDRRHKGRELNAEYRNQILTSCRGMVVWFVSRCLCGVGLLARQEAVNAHKAIWKDLLSGTDEEKPFNDLSDSEYEQIEKTLRGGRNVQDLDAVELRNYLMWRLAWEFGLRVGEILALRLKDINDKNGYEYLAIVRIDHRDEIDPRSPHQPKVKTRSRELGYIEKASEIPEMLDLYFSTHRLIYRVVNSKVVPSQFLPHDYVFIAHNSTARPLSLSGAQKAALKISNDSEVRVRWHRIRHSFFNRKYEKALQSEKPAENIRDLVYYGGWKDEKSLLIYIKRITRDNARKGLVALNTKRGE